jgi:pimeloyl-ACP methyl ester carboxylesterase
VNAINQERQGAMTVTTTAVFVHGSPETAAIWPPLLRELKLSRFFLLSPPGFGAPVPSGFEPSMINYRDWLIGELEKFHEPVHLVGHDWGGGHVINTVLARPDLVRTWVSDAIGLFDPDYEWHELAAAIQASGQGEELIHAFIGPQLEVLLTKSGLNAEVAHQLTMFQDVNMGYAMLDLYRSAAQPAMREAGIHLHAAARRPGLAIIPADDHYVGSDQMRLRSAERAGAQPAKLSGVGHWWMLEDPAGSARILREFWATHDQSFAHPDESGRQ